MEIWRFKSCTRCGGDICLSREGTIWSECCLQCGYRWELGGIDGHERTRAKREVALAVRPVASAQV